MVPQFTGQLTEMKELWTKTNEYMDQGFGKKNPIDPIHVWGGKTGGSGFWEQW